MHFTWTVLYIYKVFLHLVDLNRSDSIKVNGKVHKYNYLRN